MDSDQPTPKAADPLFAVEQLRTHVLQLEIDPKIKQELLDRVAKIATDIGNKVWNLDQANIQLKDRNRELNDELQKVKTSVTKINEYYEEQVRIRDTRLQFDPLTRCYEKTYFLADVLTPLLKAAAIDRRYKDRRSRWLVLWVVDIGHFKATNDNLGHNIGDKVLKRFGRILRASVRMKDKVDYPVRYGGDEFAVLMTQVTDLGVVLDVANRFRTRVLTRKWWGIHPQLESDFRPRPDIGVACLRMSSLENLTDQSKLQAIVESWIEKADKLMYQAKREDEIFLRCYEYDPDSDRHLSEADPQIFRLELEQDRRHQ